MKQPRRATKKTSKETSKKPTSSSPKKRYLKIFSSVFLIIAVVVGICLGCDFSTNNDDITDGSVIAPVDKKEGKINVLLLGVDIEGLRTDAMIVASYDISENKVNLLSIPRDTRMYIGTKYQKINAAHAIGGMKGKIAGPEGSIEAVTRLTAIPINYYIEFSFGAIDNFINALGGVDFDVPDVEGKGRGMNYDDPVQSLHIHLKPGMQHLNGNQVQQLLRYRKSNTKGLGYPEGDRGRVSMQQDFLRALVDQKFTAANLSNLPEIITSIKEGLKTNMSVVDMAKYAKYLKDFSSENITAYQLPGEGNGTDYGASYWICNLEETKELIQNVFGYDASKITIDSPDGSSKSKDKKTSGSSSSKDSSSKTSKETEAPDEIKDNSDDEDYSSKTVKVTNPPLPTKIPSLKPEENDDENSSKNNISDNEDVSQKYNAIINHHQTSAPDKSEDNSDKQTENNDSDKKTDPIRITPKPADNDSGKTENNSDNSVPKKTETPDKTEAPDKTENSDKSTEPPSKDTGSADSDSKSEKSEPDENKTPDDDDTKKDHEIISLD